MGLPVTQLLLASRNPVLGCGGLSDPRRASLALFRPGKDSFTSWGLAGRRAALQTRVEASVGGNASPEFFLADYVEAKVMGCEITAKHGHAIVMKLVDSDSAIPIFVGTPESESLKKELGGLQSARPMTHDLMKSTLEALGYKVSKVRVTQLVGNTYYARIHYSKGADRQDPKFEEVDIDARPSDAINMAVRFGAPVYIAKDVAMKMADKLAVFHTKKENNKDIVASCREALSSYDDPTTFMKLDLQLAIAQENYQKASRLRDMMDSMLTSDRELSLLVAMETALLDERYEEAARLRDEFNLLLNMKRAAESQDIADVGGAEVVP